MQSRSDSNSFGIDVSHHNGLVDWHRIKTAGVKFTILKASESTRTVDSKFAYNFEQAVSVGIPVGFYHFAHVSNDPIKEAQHYLNCINGRVPDLWHVLDLENSSLDGIAFNKAQVSEWARIWLNYVEASTGKVPMIYTGASLARTHFEADLARYPLWVAHYGTETPMSNSTWSEWTVFQYSETGKVDGNGSTYMDLNEFNGDIDEYLNGFKEEEDMWNKVLDMDDWAWADLEKLVGDAYNDGLIENWDWYRKVKEREITTKEAFQLQVAIVNRRKNQYFS